MGPNTGISEDFNIYGIMQKDRIYQNYFQCLLLYFVFTWNNGAKAKLISLIKQIFLYEINV